MSVLINTKIVPIGKNKYEGTGNKKLDTFVLNMSSVGEYKVNRAIDAIINGLKALGCINKNDSIQWVSPSGECWISHAYKKGNLYPHSISSFVSCVVGEPLSLIDFALLSSSIWMDGPINLIDFWSVFHLKNTVHFKILSELYIKLLFNPESIDLKSVDRLLRESNERLAFELNLPKFPNEFHSTEKAKVYARIKESYNLYQTSKMMREVHERMSKSISDYRSEKRATIAFDLISTCA